MRHTFLFVRDHAGPVLRFALVGAVGFLVDSAALYLGLALGLDLFSGRIVSYFIAATTTWYLHRNHTFRLDRHATVAEWLRFLGTNAFGGAVNIGGYAVLVLSAHVFRQFPVLAVAIGALGGMVINYLLSAFIVFRSSAPAPGPQAKLRTSTEG